MKGCSKRLRAISAFRKESSGFVRLALPVALSVSIFTLGANPIGTAFTYQGQFQDSGAAANGTYDFAFALYDAATNGNQIGPTLTNSAVSVNNGLIFVNLDFGGNVFSSNALWLAIGARTNGSANPFTALFPLQALTPVPYANYAASGLTTTSLTNSLTIASNLTVGGIITGNGSGITNLNPAHFSGGVLPVSSGGTGASSQSGAFANLMPSLYDATSDDPNLDGTPALGAGQILVTHDGFMYYAVASGVGVWNALYNFQGGVTTLGSSSKMSPISLGPTWIYTMGNPSFQTAALKNYDSQVIQVNCNPYTSGSGWDCALVGTNYSPTYLPLSTNSNGEVIYLIDRVALSLLIAPMQAIPADLPGFGQVVMNGTEQFALDSALVIDGIPGNYSYFQTDPLHEQLHFMKWTGGIFTNGDPASVDIMTVDYQQGQVTVPNLATSNITAQAVNVNGSKWFSGTGSPEGIITAGVGSIYTRTDGGPGQTLYVKESGTSNTGWTAK